MTSFRSRAWKSLSCKAAFTTEESLRFMKVLCYVTPKSIRLFSFVTHCYRPQGNVMFSRASVILFTIAFMDTRSLLILVGYSVTTTVGSVRILLECFLVATLFIYLFIFFFCAVTAKIAETNDSMYQTLKALKLRQV